MSKIRDLHDDLAICEAATPGPWIVEGSNVICRGYTLMVVAYAGSQNDISFIAEAREGWPYAIRRAFEAEAEVKRLREERDFWARNEYSLGEKVTRLARELEQRENEIDRLRNELNILQEQLEQRCAQV